MLLRSRQMQVGRPAVELEPLRDGEAGERRPVARRGSPDVIAAPATQPAGERGDGLGRDVRDDEVGGGQLAGPSRRGRWRRARRRSRPRSRCVTSTAIGSSSSAEHRPVAEERGGDREHAGAAADVEHAAARDVRRAARGRAASSGARRCRRRGPGRSRPRAAVVGRRSQGGPIQSPPDHDRPVEVAPAVLPAGLDVVARLAPPNACQSRSSPSPLV